VPFVISGLEFSPAKLVLRPLLVMHMAPMMIMLMVVLIVLTTDMLTLPIDLIGEQALRNDPNPGPTGVETDPGPRDMSR
jgi:hypothetical protein